MTLCPLQGTEELEKGWSFVGNSSLWTPCGKDIRKRHSSCTKFQRSHINSFLRFCAKECCMIIAMLAPQGILQQRSAIVRRHPRSCSSQRLAMTLKIKYHHRQQGRLLNRRASACGYRCRSRLSRVQVSCLELPIWFFDVSRTLDTVRSSDPSLKALMACISAHFLLTFLALQIRVNLSSQPGLKSRPCHSLSSGKCGLPVQQTWSRAQTAAMASSACAQYASTRSVSCKMCSLA